MTHSSPSNTRVKTRIAINGYGRVGRCIARALAEQPQQWPLELVAINEPALVDNAAIARLTQYDSVHGRSAVLAKATDSGIQLGEHCITRFQQSDAAKLDWRSLNVDIVLDCSGINSREQADKHLASGAKRVLISAPVNNADFTVVFGYNQEQLPAEAQVVSNASCTANCLTLLLDPLHADLGIEQGFITTVHAWTSDQQLVDGWHVEPRRERAAPSSIVPTGSGAAKGVMALMPELRGKLSAHSLRVPVSNMSLAEITLQTSCQTDTEELLTILQAAAEAKPGLLSVCDQPLVSCDFIQDPHSAIVDKAMTMASGQLVKVLAWHDNEWAYACRMLDSSVFMALQAG